MTDERQCTVLLAMQQALLGEVSARLRAVEVSWTETRIHFNCYFDGEIDEEDREAMMRVDTELVAEFPETHSISHTIIRLDYPAPLPQEHIRAFRRREFPLKD